MKPFAVLCCLSLAVTLSASALGGVSRGIVHGFSDDFRHDPTASGRWSISTNNYAESDLWEPETQEVYLSRNTGGGSAIFARYDLEVKHWVAHFQYRAGGGSGADGLTFMFYKDKDAYGTPSGGGNLGFSADIPQTVGVAGYGIEFDSNQNNADPSSNHIALIQNDFTHHLVAVDDLRTEDNVWHDVLIHFDDGRIRLWLDQNQAPLIDYTILSPDYSFSGVGFSAGTGGLANEHVIDDFYILEGRR